MMPRARSIREVVMKFTQIQSVIVMYLSLLTIINHYNSTSCVFSNSPSLAVVQLTRLVGFIHDLIQARHHVTGIFKGS